SLGETVQLPGYKGSLRQLAVTGLGRAQPTLFLSNNPKESARALIVRYAGRNRVEDGLGMSVHCFHVDCLASEVRLNVDLDTTMTVLANGCYRWLAKQLRGFDTAAPKQLYRKFVETAGVVEIQPERLVVHFDKRCHNPILREAALDQPSQGIPWFAESPCGLPVPVSFSSRPKNVDRFCAAEIGDEAVLAVGFPGSSSLLCQACAEC